MKKIILSILLAGCSAFVYAQLNLETKNVVLDKYNKINYAETNFTFSYKEAIRTLESLFGTQANSSFIFERSYKDNLGITHHIYQQYHLGLKVMGATAGMHEKEKHYSICNC